MAIQNGGSQASKFSLKVSSKGKKLIHNTRFAQQCIISYPKFAEPLKIYWLSKHGVYQVNSLFGHVQLLLLNYRNFIG